MFLRQFLLSIVVAATVHSAQWLRLKSANFELITTSGESQGREALQHFEQVADFFKQLNQTASASPIPIRIILFADAKQFAPYRYNNAAAAFFRIAPDADYIVLSGASKELYTIALHEYVHLLIRRSRRTLPLWLEEGFADLFSTLKPVGNQTQIGAAPPGRTQRLIIGQLLPLRVLISADRNSPHYNEASRMGLFYSEAWALTHMLRLSNAFRPKFETFFNLVLAGHSTEDALEKAYGRSLGEVEGYLMAYLARGRLSLALVPISLKKEMPTPLLLPDADYFARLSLATLLLATDPSKAVEQLQAMKEEFPSRPEITTSLAYHWASTGKAPQAMDAMAQAISMGYKNPRLYKDYAQMLLSTGNTSLFLINARRQLELEPDDHEQRLRIAAVLFQMADYSQALGELKKIPNPPSDMLARYYQGIAACSIKLGDWAELNRALEELRKVSHKPEELQELNKLDAEAKKRSP